MYTNEYDPITLDAFNNMEQREIIVIEQNRFHLPSLYEWAITRENERNPLTNVPFTDEQLGYIIETAKQNYPLRIKVKALDTRRATVNTTSLIPFWKLTALIYLAMRDDISLALTPYQLFQTITQVAATFILFKYDQIIKRSEDGFFNHEFDSMQSILDTTQMTASWFEISVPQLINFYESLIAKAQQRNWPIENLKECIESVRWILKEAERTGQRSKQFNDTIPPLGPQPEGTLRVKFNTIVVLNGTNISVESDVYAPINGQLSDLEPLVRQRIPMSDVILKQDPFKYIHDGKYRTAEMDITELGYAPFIFIA